MKRRLPPKRNPVARYLRVNRPQKVAPRKGRGSFKRNPKHLKDTEA